MSKPTDLVQGTLDLLILKTVAVEPMHGWAIAQRIRQCLGLRRPWKQAITTIRVSSTKKNSP